MVDSAVFPRSRVLKMESSAIFPGWRVLKMRRFSKFGGRKAPCTKTNSENNEQTTELSFKTREAS